MSESIEIITQQNQRREEREAELLGEYRARTSHEDRLKEETTKFFETEGRLKGLRRRRTMLALKLFEMGLSERAIGELAGVSGACVHQWRQRFQTKETK